MTISTEDLLLVLASSLRSEVGPAVEEPFAKTQAFMTAVILEKLAGQLRATGTEGPQAEQERTALAGDIRALLQDEPANAVHAAAEQLAEDGNDRVWGDLVRAIYAERERLGEPVFDRLLHRTRRALRARLDRKLVYSA